MLLQVCNKFRCTLRVCNNCATFLSKKKALGAFPKASNCDFMFYADWLLLPLSIISFLFVVFYLLFCCGQPSCATLCETFLKSKRKGSAAALPQLKKSRIGYSTSPIFLALASTSARCFSASAILAASPPFFRRERDCLAERSSLAVAALSSSILLESS